MPVVHVRALPQPAADVRAACMAAATALAAELREPPHGTWVTWQTVDAYADGVDPAEEQPSDTHPPIAYLYDAGGSR